MRDQNGPKWSILVHFGLKRSILVHLGPPTVLWPFLIDCSTNLMISLRFKHRPGHVMQHQRAGPLRHIDPFGVSKVNHCIECVEHSSGVEKLPPSWAMLVNDLDLHKEDDKTRPQPRTSTSTTLPILHLILGHPSG